MRLNPRQVPADRQRLALIRQEELTQAAAILGVTHVYQLGYHDSGMAGWASNQERQAFVQTPLEDVTGRVVPLIRRHRPDVVVTYDAHGGYGHPDHIAIYKHTTSAFHAAADAVQFPELGPAHSVAKLYYSAFPRSSVRALGEWMHSQNYQGSFSNLDPEKLGMPDEQINVWLNVEPWREQKDRSRSMHRTQLDPNNLMAKIPEEIQRNWRSHECYQLAASRVGPDVPGENDLFARIQ